jgi:transposase
MLKGNKIKEDILQHPELENKMLREGHHCAIKELYAKGTAKRAIARLLGVDIKTVRRHLNKKEWTAYQRDTGNQKRLLGDEEAWLIGRIPEVGYNATVLLRELKLRGYQGSYETVKAFVHPYRQKATKACVRYETDPGEQSQVDWGSSWVWLGESRVKVHFFGMVLGYSRRMYVKGYLNERFPNLINGHEEAFQWFGGMTREILYDNAKTMITTHNIQTGELVLNRQFKDFSQYYGFDPRFCHPYRPQTKGKIESGVKYIKRNFLPGRRFRDLAHLNSEIEKWLLEVADKRLHGTTHQRPADRFIQETLIPILRPQPYAYVSAIQRKVSQDSMISFEANLYSVPWIYVGRCVDLRITQGQLLISTEGKTIATHLLLQGKHQQSISKEHYTGLFHSKRKKHEEKPPQYDPYWKKEDEVMIRDLAIYEKAAFMEPPSFLMH